MSQPPTYARQFNFTNFSTLYPTTPQPGVSIDAEFNHVKTTLDAVNANLALIQKDDGTLANLLIGINNLKPELLIGVTQPLDWVTATAYAVNIVVWHSSALYRCLIAHTSGTFSTDLAAVKWQSILDYTNPLGQAAASASAAAASATTAAASVTSAATQATAAAASATAAAASAALSAAYVASITFPLPINQGGTASTTASTARAALGLIIGTNVQAYNANLATFAAIAPTANVQTLLAAADNAAIRTAIGLGTAAVATTGTTGHVLGFLDGNKTDTGVNTYSGVQSILNGGNFQLRVGANSSYNWSVSRATSGNFTVAEVNAGVETNAFTISTVGLVGNFPNGLQSGGNTVLTTSTGVQKSGDTMTGNLVVQTANAFIDIYDTAATANYGRVRMQSYANVLSIYALADNASTGNVFLAFNRVGTTLDNVTAGCDIVLYGAGPSSVFSAGYNGAPLMGGAAVNAIRTFAKADMGKTAYHDEVTARVWTIDSNANYAAPIGSIILIDNTGNGGAAGTITLQITTDTLRRGDGTAGTGSRTFAAGQRGGAQKVKATEWVAFGQYS